MRFLAFLLLPLCALAQQVLITQNPGDPFRVNGLTPSTLQTGQPYVLTTTSASGTTYTATGNPTVTALTKDAVFTWDVGATLCTAGAITLNVDGLGAKSIKESDGATNPVAGDCPANQIVRLAYDGTLFRIVGGGAVATVGGITSLTTDVVAAGPGAAVATIQPGVVTLAKQANLAANSIQGNNTGAPATPIALTVAQVNTLLGTALTANPLSQFAATTSAQLFGVVSDETGGAGVLVGSASPALTGTPTAPTPAATDNSTTLATTAYVTTGITNAVNAAAGRDLVQAATAAVLPNTPTFTHVDSGIGSFFTSSTNSVLVVDGYTPVLLDRILVKNQATAANNGIYSVTQLGVAAVTPWILTRTLDYDQASDMNNTIVPVANHGTANALTSWIMTATVATVDTDAVNFAAFTPNGANIVTAASPGVGIGHFAGGTQALTSSLIVAADITANTITSSQVNNSIALTGTDINTSNQVTATHLASALPVAQGGWGLATLTAHALYVGNTTSAPNALAVCGTDNPVVGVAGADPICSKVVLTSPATAATLTILNNKTFTVNKTLTLDGTDGVTYTGPSTSQTIPGMNQANTAGSSFTWDMSAAGAVAGHKVPVAAGAAPTANGAFSYDSTANGYVGGVNGVTNFFPIATKLLTFTGATAARSIALPVDAAFTIARQDAAQTFTGVQTFTSPAITTPTITGNITTAGTAPAVSCTGLGTGSCSSFGNDTMWEVLLSPTGSPAATGTVIATWNVAAAGTGFNCGFVYRNGSGTWGAGLLPLVVSTHNTTTETFTWAQTSALTAGSSYAIDFNCTSR